MSKLKYYNYGELIEVRDSDANSWIKERFLCFSLQGRAVTEDEDGIISYWIQHRNVSKEIEITLKEIADKFGIIKV